MGRDGSLIAYTVIFTYPLKLKDGRLMYLPAGHVVLDLETHPITKDNNTPPIVVAGFAKASTYVGVHTIRLDGSKDRVEDASLINLALGLAFILERSSKTCIWAYNKGFEKSYLEKYSSVLSLKHEDYDIEEIGPMTEDGKVYKSLNLYAWEKAREKRERGETGILDLLPFNETGGEIIERMRINEKKNVEEMMHFAKLPIPLEEIEDALGRVLNKIRRKSLLDYLPLEGETIGYLAKAVSQAMQAIHNEEPAPNFVHDAACLGTIPIFLKNIRDVFLETYLVLDEKSPASHYNNDNSPLELNLSQILTSRPSNLLLILGLRIPKDGLKRLIDSLEDYIFQVHVKRLGEDDDTKQVYDELLNYSKTKGWI
jgi:hypothetical protein